MTRADLIARLEAATDECVCGDYRRDHDERGCKLCGDAPWERMFPCKAFRLGGPSVVTAERGR